MFHVRARIISKIDNQHTSALVSSHPRRLYTITFCLSGASPSALQPEVKTRIQYSAFRLQGNWWSSCTIILWLQLRINLPLFSTVFPSNSCCFCLVGLSLTVVNCPSQETEVTSTSEWPVENVVITTKGLQDRNNLLLDGRTVENKGTLAYIWKLKYIKQY